MYMICKHYLERVFGWERSKLRFFGEKRFETQNFLTELMSVRLSKCQASSKRACPVDSGHSSFERAVSELQANVTSGFGHSSLERAASEGWPEAANGVKWRARRDSQKQQTPFLLFRALRGQSELSKICLLTCLISVYTLKPTGTSYGSNWTWFCELNLTFEKCPRMFCKWIELNFWKLNLRQFFRKLVFSSEWCGITYVCCLDNQ